MPYPKKLSQLSPKLIMTPLVVMLFLTILTGWNAYYLTYTWEEASKAVSVQMTETVLLNNIHWQLSQISLKASSENPVLEKNWHIIQQHLDTLSRMPHVNLNLKQQQKLLQLEHKLFSNGIIDKPHLNKALLDETLQQNFFSDQLQKTQELMEGLKIQTQRMITLISGALVFLGFILMSITAYDFIRLFSALKVSRDLNIQLQEEERRRIAQDLHDGVVQEMIDLKRLYAPEKVDHIIDNLRRVCHNLKPQILEDLGLSAALQFLVEDLRVAGIADVSVNLDEGALDTLPRQYELPVFRILQELCANIKKHAAASQCHLTLEYAPQKNNLLKVYVKDNGQGFTPKAKRQEQFQHMGLTGVEERVTQLGGQISIQSTPKTEATRQTCGTIVRFQIPIERRHNRPDPQAIKPTNHSNATRKPSP